MVSPATSPYIDSIKALQAVDIIMVFGRATRFYAVSSELGPKLLILYRMIKNLLTFLAFFLILLLAYGVASQAVLFPAVAFDAQSVWGVLFRPYFQLYGELDLGKK